MHPSVPGRPCSPVPRWAWFEGGWSAGGSVGWVPLGIFVGAHVAWLVLFLLALRRAEALWRWVRPWFFVPLRLATRLVVPCALTWLVVDYSLGGPAAVLDWTDFRVETLLAEFPQVSELIEQGVLSRDWVLYGSGVLTALGLVAAVWYACDLAAILIAYQLELVASFQRGEFSGTGAPGATVRSVRDRAVSRGRVRLEGEARAAALREELARVSSAFSDLDVAIAATGLESDGMQVSPAGAGSRSGFAPEPVPETGDGGPGIEVAPPDRREAGSGAPESADRDDAAPSGSPGASSPAVPIGDDGSGPAVASGGTGESAEGPSVPVFDPSKHRPPPRLVPEDLGDDDEEYVEEEPDPLEGDVYRPGEDLHRRYAHLVADGPEEPPPLSHEEVMADLAGGVEVPADAPAQSGNRTGGDGPLPGDDVPVPGDGADEGGDGESHVEVTLSLAISGTMHVGSVQSRTRRRCSRRASKTRRVPGTSFPRSTLPAATRNQVTPSPIK